MAKYAVMIHGDFDEFNDYLARSIAGSSLSASKEDSHEFICPNMRCKVQVFERYSAFGSNRVSMNVTVVVSAVSCRLPELRQAAVRVYCLNLIPWERRISFIS